MKAQNKIFNLSIAAIVVTTLFLPHFVLAEDAIEPAPIVIAPEAPAPEPMPEIPTPEIPTPEVPAPEVPVVESPAEETVITETPLEPTSETPPVDIPEPEIQTPDISKPEIQTIVPLVLETPAEEKVIEETQSEEQVVSKTSTTETSNEQSTTLETPVSNSVHLTIRIDDRIVYSGTTDISAESIDLTDNTGTPTTTLRNNILGMITAADAASDNFSITDLAYYASLNSFFINCISADNTPSCYNWQYTVNNIYPGIGIDHYNLNNGDEVYLYFGAKNRFTVSTTTLQLGQSLTMRVEKYDYINNVFVPFSNTIVGAILPDFSWPPNVIASSTTNADGQATFVIPSTGTYSVGIDEDGYYPSETVTVTLPQTIINLNLQTKEGTFFKEDITVTACKDTSTVYTLNAWCALEQTAAKNNWTLGTTSGSLIFLNDVNEYVFNYPTAFWSWYSNLQLGETALNKHILSENENIMLTYGVNPIKLEVSSTTPTVGTTTTISISELNFAAWPAEWVGLSSTTLHLNDTTVDLSTGTYEFVPTVTTTVFVTKTGYVSSDSITIIPGAVASTNSNPTNTGTGGGSNTNENNTITVTFDVNAAGNFLLTKQNSDGSIGSASLYSDWAAMAIGSLGNSSAKAGLITYLKTNPNAGTTATDYERRAMALLALGLNPYSDTPTNYIAEIMKKYDGTQFGDAGLVNDDIFAIFPLLKSGYSTNDVEIQKAVAFILSKQNNAGGWESPDMTAAAVQALSQVKSITGVNEALTKAKNYLKTSTKTDGRIGDNTFSTGWGLQALSALGESATTWNGENPSPLNYLASQQQTDGAVNPTSDTNDNRIWATSYAIPGAQGRTWESILISVPKSVSNTNNTTAENISSTSTSTTQTVTSTQAIISTTTSQFVTTTPVIILPIENLESIIEPVVEPIIETLPGIATTNEAPLSPNSITTSITESITSPPVQAAQITPPSDSPATGEQLSAPSPETPVSGSNKALFGGAAAVAGTAGAYLAWRFLQGLV